MLNAGWARLSRVGNHILKQASDFDPEDYGSPKLSALADAVGLFEISKKEQHLFIKDNRAEANA